MRAISRGKAYRVFALDFETHNDEETIAKNETSIWLSCLIDETSTPESDCFDYDIPSLLKRLDTLSEKDPLLVYVYNLSFEWSFILPVLLHEGFSWKPKIDKGDTFAFNSVTTKTCTSVWEAKIVINHKPICFRDLSKLFPGGLGNIARNMGIPTQKGEIDYTLNRLHGHVVTKEEKEYCFKDCRIVIEILERMKDDKVFWSSLSSSSYACRHMLEVGFGGSKKSPIELYREMYPHLDERTTEFLRKAVSGGISYPVDNWRGRDIVDRTIAHIDGHQMHPSSAYMNKFPWGEPWGGGYGKPDHDDGMMSCCHIRFSYDGVKLHSQIPLIGYPFMKDFALWVWDFEIPTMLKCYENPKVEYLDYITFLAMELPWKEFYRENYERRAEEKRKGNLFLAQIYKLRNNSSYGKLLEHAHNYDRENYLGEDGIIDSRDHPLEDETALDGHYTYLPVGSCIPAYSRVRLIETALKIGWEKILYFDTDSIFFVKDEETMKACEGLDFDDHLGGWGWEEDLVRFKVTAPKRYKGVEVNHGTIVRSAGFQLKTAITLNGLRYEVPYDEINIDSAVYEVKRAYRARGGTIVKVQLKEMRNEL